VTDPFRLVTLALSQPPTPRDAGLDCESAYRAIVRVTAMHSVEGTVGNSNPAYCSRPGLYRAATTASPYMRSGSDPHHNASCTRRSPGETRPPETWRSVPPKTKTVAFPVCRFIERHCRSPWLPSRVPCSRARAILRASRSVRSGDKGQDTRRSLSRPRGLCMGSLK
jgi:hypothetical protein